MFDDKEQSRWRIAGIDFVLNPVSDQPRASPLCPQTPQRDILSRLVHVAYPEASRCALDVNYMICLNWRDLLSSEPGPNKGAGGVAEH